MSKNVFKKVAVAIVLTVTMAVSVFGSSAAPLVSGNNTNTIANRIVSNILPGTTAKTTKTANTSSNSALVKEYADAELKTLEKVLTEDNIIKTLELYQKGVTAKNEITFTPTKALLEELGVTHAEKINTTKFTSNATLKGDKQYQDFALYNGTEKTLTGKIWFEGNQVIVEIPELTKKYITVPAATLALTNTDITALKNAVNAIGKRFITTYVNNNLKKVADVNVKAGGVNVKADSYTITLTEKQVRELVYYALGQIKASKSLTSALDLSETVLDALRNELKSGRVYDFDTVDLVTYVANGEAIAHKLKLNGDGVTNEFLLAAFETTSGKYVQTFDYRVKSFSSYGNGSNDVVSYVHTGAVKDGVYAGSGKLAFLGEDLATFSYTNGKKVVFAKSGVGFTGDFTAHIPSLNWSVKGTVTADVKNEAATVKLTASKGKEKLFDFSVYGSVGTGKAVATAPKLTKENSISSNTVLSDKEQAELNANLIKLKAKYEKTTANDIIGYLVLAAEKTKTIG